ncbi:MAG: transposase [Bryobacterales bacterium]|nr:transposase [Bryobacterales bacterium]
MDVPHHVTQRGNHRAPIFYSNQDRHLYLELLSTHFTEQRVDLVGHCLMANHVHLVVIPRRPESLALGIGRVHQEYSRWLQIRRRQTGHLFQNRFHSAPLDYVHTWQALLYTELNPVRAGMVDSAVDYPWSSARSHAGLDPFPAWLNPAPWAYSHTSTQWADILEVGFRNHGQLERIRHALASGRPVGSEDFIDELEARLGRSLRPSKGGRPSARTPDGNDASGQASAATSP